MKNQNSKINNKSRTDRGVISLLLVIIIGLLAMKYVYNVDPLQYFAPVVVVIQKIIALLQNGLTILSKVLSSN